MREILMNAARETLQTEINEIICLSERVNEPFIDACKLILKCRGKVIVSGIGKSGHIGKKIAATLASTGTPAFYVHPTEALHGDLGMIATGDVVILISYSGHAAEFRRMMPLLRVLPVGVIAFTGNPDSPLACSADHVINTYVTREACPLGLAPTSSAVCTLMMGDAMAIALMKARNFSEQDYARTHPSGSLGARLLCQVGDIMRTDNKLPQVKDDAIIADALFELTRTGIGLVAVTDSAEIICGVFTDGDLRRWLMKDGKLNERVTEAMTSECFSFSPSQLAAEVLATFNEKKISAAPVVSEDFRLIGAISMHDIHDAGL
ncbi:KpsF/GutQ family sugar-phosphate isomerase [Enterobacter roggenkampii]|uniref:KpsF/GutQ family sugar-phosphate isomerase n=1 Tax=Enterobacter roggenkampii TaxID=1812935 RepID=UPI0008DCC9C6|nr:KpsF/GutQ family sugar-phosphate isomerase [Enterobacter roggenkampii]OHY45162.1 arabinose 5-phosphate isomerase GutQ [Enterobacter roggenkampii]OHY63605.1 arabinose 5-phosphate isomerase GutQ [Enterobacter roggenkampii]